ncbi:hypothetical protein TELCIR_18972, partial [Teladorsagia circumcincta]
MPPLYGVWTKKGLGYFMELRTENGHLFSRNCLPNEELVMIMSNSRHPQTLQLFKSAKLIEDAACIDILQFKTLDTYNECTNNTELTPMSGPCGVVEGWTPLNTAMLQGVWYFAADLNADPKIFLQSAVITLTPNETKYGSQL